MADLEKLRKQKQAQKPQKKKTGGFLLLILITPIAIALMPTTIVLLLGFIPTLVAHITDRDPEKMASLTVGLTNAAAIAPVLFDLWTGGHTIDNAFLLLHRPMTWVIMFGGAGVGWLLHLGIPPVVASAVALQARARIKILQHQQKVLTDEWGDGLKK